MSTFSLYTNSITTDSVSFSGSFIGGDAAYSRYRYVRIRIIDSQTGREWTFDKISTYAGSANSYFDFTISDGDRDKSNITVSFTAGRTYTWSAQLCYVDDHGSIVPASSSLSQSGSLTLKQPEQQVLELTIESITSNSVSFTAYYEHGDASYTGQRYLRIKDAYGTKIGSDHVQYSSGLGWAWWNTITLSNLSSSTYYTFIATVCQKRSNGTIYELDCDELLVFTTLEAQGYKAMIYDSGSMYGRADWYEHIAYIYDNGWQVYKPRIFNGSIWEPV